MGLFTKGRPYYNFVKLLLIGFILFLSTFIVLLYREGGMDFRSIDYAISVGLVSVFVLYILIFVLHKIGIL